MHKLPQGVILGGGGQLSERHVPVVSGWNVLCQSRGLYMRCLHDRDICFRVGIYSMHSVPIWDQDWELDIVLLRLRVR